MKRTKVYATEAEAKEIKELAIIARNTPVIAFSTEDALSGNDLASLAMQAMHKCCHKAALAHGLPEIPGYYGIDLSNREFIEGGGEK